MEVWRPLTIAVVVLEVMVEVVLALATSHRMQLVATASPSSASSHKGHTMKFAILNNGEVVNVALADSPLGPEWVAIDADSLIGVGWRFGPNGFIEPVAAPIAAPSRIRTHNQFRSLFTQTEQELIDELEATFETNPDIPQATKRQLRTGYKNYYSATEVDLDDPRIAPMLGLYLALGYLTAERMAEVMS
jgi:hypothetical protein